MINSLYALTLTDSLHLPTVIGYYNTKQAASQARQSARLYLAHESQPLDDPCNFFSTVTNILDTCINAIKKNPAHYVDMRIKIVDDLSDPETTPFTVYYETVAGDRHFTMLNTITDLAAIRIISHTVPNCKVITVTTPGDLIETVGYTEVKPEMLDALAIHQPKSTADSLIEFAKLADAGTITRSQFETFARCAINSPQPNESSADLKATADALRKSLNEGTAILL